MNHQNREYIIKKFLLTTVTLSFLVLMIVYSFEFDLSDDYLINILFFDRFLDEYIIAYLLILLFMNKFRISKWLGIFFFIIYLSLNTIQLTSYIISGEFLSKLAINNIEFIGLIVGFETIIVVLIVMVLLILLPSFLGYIVYKFTKISNVTSNKVFISLLILIGLLSHFSSKIMSTTMVDQRTTLYKQNHLTHTAPIQSLVKVFRHVAKEYIYFTNKDVQEINQLGFTFNPSESFPLTKEYVFKNIKFKMQIKPNIIVLFTEGYSARTSGVYNDKFSDLTPNLLDFSKNKNTMTVHNYFNHTAATYRGLHGQLCSIYPTYGGAEGWADNLKNLPKVKYKCLPHILNNQGYHTTWLNMHYKDASSNEEMVAHFGFDSIISADELSKSYSDQKGLRDDFLTDHEAYASLIKYLEHDYAKDTPLLLGMYTVETHAWMNISKDGVKYRDGKYNSLNTIHNMDDAFGDFWKWFQKSKYYNNTIIIFTSDHAHYYEKPYVKAMAEYGENDYRKLFVDKVPLMIYNPLLKLDNTFVAKNATSVDLVPTILQLLNINDNHNSFMGSSIFEQQESHIGVVSIGLETYIIKEGMIYSDFDVDDKNKHTLELVKKFMKHTHKIEVSDKIINKE